MLVISALLAWLLVFAGSLALILPGVFAAVCLLLLRPVVLFDARNPLHAISRCFSLARPHVDQGACQRRDRRAGLRDLRHSPRRRAWGFCESLLTLAGIQPAALSAFAAACGLGVQAVALVYFNSLWLVLYSTASSSA